MLLLLLLRLLCLRLSQSSRPGHPFWISVFDNLKKVMDEDGAPESTAHPTPPGGCASEFDLAASVSPGCLLPLTQKRGAQGRGGGGTRARRVEDNHQPPPLLLGREATCQRVKDQKLPMGSF